MPHSAFSRVAGVVFGIIAVLQAYRAVMQIPVQIGATSVPVGVSWVAGVVMASLCFWAFRTHR